MHARTLLVALVLLPALAGCTAEEPGRDDEDEAAVPFTAPSLRDYPPGVATQCPPAREPARGLDVPFTVDAGRSARAGAPNLVEVAPAADPERPVIRWTWRDVDPGERPDRITRAETWDVWRNATGHHFLCGSVTLVAPSNDTPPAKEPFSLVVLASPDVDLPPGNYSVIVNWEVGCPSCGGVPRGSATTAFSVPDPAADPGA